MLRKWKSRLDTRIIAERDRFEEANVEQKSSKFYVHGTVHLSNTSHINTNDMQLFYSLYLVTTTHSAHHQAFCPI